MDSASLTLPELNAGALERFIYQPVSKSMIRYLADAAYNVITCDSTLMPTPIIRTGSGSLSSATAVPTTADPTAAAAATPEPQRVQPNDGGLPTLEEFITQLVCSSNVQVPTLMSTLVYLTRLRSRLQPMARGLRCTSHRIFLAALILAAKYLNDSSPKNVHWAKYSHMITDMYSFGFSRTEVNLMEKQLLFLLDWDLRIRDEDLYRELDMFLSPIRDELELKHARRIHRRRLAEERARAMQQQEQEHQLQLQMRAQIQMQAQIQAQMHQIQQQQRLPRQDVFSTPATSIATTSAALYLSPPDSCSGAAMTSANIPQLNHHHHHHRPSSVGTPDLTYSSSSGTPYSNTTPDSQLDSRSTTPLPADSLDGSYMLLDGSIPAAHSSAYEAAASGEIVVVEDRDGRRSRKGSAAASGSSSGRLLPYELSADELRELQEEGAKSSKRMRMGRTVLGRVFGAVSVR